MAVKKRKPLTFGQAIAAARKAANLTQQELADAMGIQRPGLARMETKGDGVREDMIRRAAIAMDLSISDLLAAC